jgi:hypothetical protein
MAMAIAGADIVELRNAASQLEKGAQNLATSLSHLNHLVSNGTQWRGPDAERFRSAWTSQSVKAISSAVETLQRGSQELRRNADEQDNASAVGGASAGGTGSASAARAHPAPAGLHGLWNGIHDIPKVHDAAGYRVQEVMCEDGKTRYIVYIAGTDAADGQSKISNIAAASGVPDDKQLDALKRLIPNGAEVMLVGYSQGGMDAQNIAMQNDNGFKVAQVVTFGSPARADLDVPAVHLQATNDGVTGSASGTPGPYFFNSTGSNENAHIYAATSDVNNQLSATGLFNVHERGYDYLSTKWDDANFGQAEGISKFRGDVTDTADLDIHGGAH